jgi:ferric-dicitrate binding protein FerR (iron transport regulator)
MTDSIDEERVLREGFKASGLTPEALQRIRAATEQEWRSVTQSPARRGWRTAGIAASVAVLVAGVGGAYLAMNTGAGNGAVLGVLAASESPGISQNRWLQPDVVLVSGSKLRAGQSFDVRGDSRVTLEGGGNMRIARATVVDVNAENSVHIQRGELYVDIPPGSRASDSFRVVTDAGEFRHQGTQFAVAIVAGETRLRVREGTVVWRAAAGDSAIDAGTEVLIDRDGKATRRAIGTAGRDWAWTESMTPEMAIDDRPLLDFLEWYARETGRKLLIDDSARRQSADIRMHGNVDGLTLSEALSAVMATTSLRYELPEGVIRVSSTREQTTPPD